MRGYIGDRGFGRLVLVGVVFRVCGLAGCVGMNKLRYATPNLTFAYLGTVKGLGFTIPC